MKLIRQIADLINRLRNDWQLKLVATVISVAIWFVVINVSNPYTVKTISGIPIEIQNEDTLTDNDLSYTVSGSTQTATIRVRAPRRIVQNLRAADFQATADFSRLYELTGQVPVSVTSLNYRISDDMITQVTQSLQVEIESISSRKIDVSVNIAGTPSEGYQVGSVTASPSVVTVTAPKSVLDQIAGVGVEINVDSVSKDMSQHAALKLYNAGGSEIDTSGLTNLSLSSEDVDVTVDILNVKSVPISGEVTGTDAVARGYRYAGMEISLESVSIYGRKKVLTDITALSLPSGSLDVTDATENVEKTFKLSDLDLPSDIGLVEAEDTEFTVTLFIEKTNSRTFRIPISDLTIENLDEGLTISNTGDTLSVTVEGLQEELDNLEQSEIDVKLDLGGQTAGMRSITAEVTVPDGFVVVGSATVSVNLVQQSDAAGAENPEGNDATAEGGDAVTEAEADGTAREEGGDATAEGAN